MDCKILLAHRSLQQPYLILLVGFKTLGNFYVILIVLIQTISDSVQTKPIDCFKASRPILRVMSNGELIEIETPNTRLAARYMDLHHRLR